MTYELILEYKGLCGNTIRDTTPEQDSDLVDIEALRGEMSLLSAISDKDGRVTGWKRIDVNSIEVTDKGIRCTGYEVDTSVGFWRKIWKAVW